jgi:hypothetical protein
MEACLLQVTGDAAHDARDLQALLGAFRVRQLVLRLRRRRASLTWHQVA